MTRSYIDRAGKATHSSSRAGTSQTGQLRNGRRPEATTGKTSLLRSARSCTEPSHTKKPHRMTREDRPHRVSRGGDRRRNSLPRGSRLSVSRASRPARRAAARARWTQGAHQAVVAGTIAFMPCGLVSRDRVGEEPLVAIPVRRPRRAQVLSRTGPRATDGASASPHAQSSRPARTLAVEAAACGLKQRRCSSVRPHASPRSLLFLVRPARHDCLGDDRMVGSGGLAGSFGSAPRIARLATAPAATCTTATSSNTKTAT